VNMWTYDSTASVEQNPLSGMWYARACLTDGTDTECVFIKFQVEPSAQEVSDQAAIICDKRNA
jgi:hypothetical protein